MKGDGGDVVGDRVAVLVLEAVAARFLATGVIQRTVAMGTLRDPMSHAELLRFYTPLALTSLLTLGVQPIVVFFMGRAQAPLESLAVLPVINGLTFIFRSMGLAYQEVGIALVGDKLENLGALARFAAILALLVILKIALDVVLHLQEHKPAQAPAPASANARP